MLTAEPAGTELRKRTFRQAWIHSNAEKLDMRRLVRLSLAVLATMLVGGCQRAEQATSSSKPTAADADAFMAGVNEDYRKFVPYLNSAKWIQENYPTPDTQMIAAQANESWLAYLGSKLDESKKFDGVAADRDTARGLLLLKLLTNSPAPNDPIKRSELIDVLANMRANFDARKWCPAADGDCLSLYQIQKIIGDPQRSPEQRAAAWAGWHETARPVKRDYAKLVELSNEGARELGFADLGEMWRAGYDMSPAEFEQTVEKLWQQLQPLYEALHCNVRAVLNGKYGDAVVPKDGLIPAHLLGDMWAQEWSNIYPLVEPYRNVSSLDLDGALQRRHDEVYKKLVGQFKGTPTAFDLTELSYKADLQFAVEVTRIAEGFYTSIGLPALPSSFYERSMFVRPRDRDAICRSSSWDIDLKDDVRLKTCVEPTSFSFYMIHHQLGRLYYYLLYSRLPPIFQAAAQAGFDEAVGDTIALSLTPAYLQRIGLVGQQRLDERALINAQMKLALDKIAFLPWGKLVDQWRWKVFAGDIKPDHYNDSWWKLREEYQGVSAPVPRSEDDFDPGAKFNIPGNTPYVRFLLAYVLQFQFQKALCDAAGFTGPLAECDIYGNKAAGEKLMEMLKAGASEPWQDTLEKLTGSREMDASALIEYFQPLLNYLKQQNEGQVCGWRGEIKAK
ncbi:MAG: M2 family metallopeptidase [Solimonas sp.]